MSNGFAYAVYLSKATNSDTIAQ